MIIIDDKTRTIRTIPLRAKTAAETTPKLRALCEEIKLMSPTNKYPKYWRMDGGTEFSKFNKWAKLHGAQIELSPPCTHELNGVAEVYGHYIIQTAHIMIIDSGLPGEMWPHAADTATYIINCLTNPKTGKSPLQMWRDNMNINKPISLDHIRIWGSTAYVHIHKEDRVQAQKMAPCASLGHLIGYEGDNGHIYRIWDPKTGRIIRTRDVYINESKASPFTPLPPAPNDPEPAPDAPANPTAVQWKPEKELHESNVRLQIEQEDVIMGRIQTLSPSVELDAI
jgi:hypothetical protein